ncbi:hypothetical protein EON63_23880 [archaeon]|nr:MAG: hypothetical protein EON63_23880 [archaeon]
MQVLYDENLLVIFIMSSAVKDGRLGYDEESGTPMLAPWMIPPNPEGGGAGGGGDLNRNNPVSFPSSAYVSIHTHIHIHTHMLTPFSYCFPLLPPISLYSLLGSLPSSRLSSLRRG